jgi:hypothetical protein
LSGATRSPASGARRARDRFTPERGRGAARGGPSRRAPAPERPLAKNPVNGEANGNLGLRGTAGCQSRTVNTSPPRPPVRATLVAAALRAKMAPSGCPSPGRPRSPPSHVCRSCGAGSGQAGTSRHSPLASPLRAPHPGEDRLAHPTSRPRCDESSALEAVVRVPRGEGFSRPSLTRERARGRLVGDARRPGRRRARAMGAQRRLGTSSAAVPVSSSAIGSPPLRLSRSRGRGSGSRERPAPPLHGPVHLARTMTAPLHYDERRTM